MNEQELEKASSKYAEERENKSTDPLFLECAFEAGAEWSENQFKYSFGAFINEMQISENDKNLIKGAFYGYLLK